MARRVIEVAVNTDRREAEVSAQAVGLSPFFREKIVAETAMLLLCLDPVQTQDPRIAQQVGELAHLLLPHARHRDVLAAICLDPGLARDYALAHSLLSRLGYPDPEVDLLLSKSLALGTSFGPERLPHRRLEQAWLARLWPVAPSPVPADARLLADSMLGRTMDALGSTRLDIYAFTHAVMYASDLGMRNITLPRPRSSVSADADAALAFSLDSNDFDLTAELLMTWPMLGLPWSPSATLAFSILAEVEDSIGFLPGLSFDLALYQTLDQAPDHEARSRLALTSYHTAYVMAYLCAAALRPGCAPPSAVPVSRRAPGSGAAVLSLLDTAGPASCWFKSLLALTPSQRDSVASLILAIVLRRARTQGNLYLIRAALEIALAHDLFTGPAPMQAAALLNRSQHLKF